MSIKKLSKSDIGLVVKYKQEGGGGDELGVVKSFNNKKQVAWVVFDCDDDWCNFANYTAEGCDYSKLSNSVGERNNVGLPYLNELPSRWEVFWLVLIEMIRRAIFSRGGATVLVVVLACLAVLMFGK